MAKRASAGLVWPALHEPASTYVLGAETTSEVQIQMMFYTRVCVVKAHVDRKTIKTTRLALLERNLRDGPSAQQTATPPASEVHELRAEMQELRKCEPAATLVGVQTC